MDEQRKNKEYHLCHYYRLRGLTLESNKPCIESALADFDTKEAARHQSGLKKTLCRTIKGM